MAGEAPELETFREARPNSTLRTLAAKFNEQKVSSALYITGLIQTNIRVLLSCERESCSTVGESV